MGTGDSLVVLDPGFQDGQRAWVAVAPQVATFARVILLDRSDPSDHGSPTGDQSLADLAEPVIALINQHAPQSDVVLAGWALGAICIQAVAIRLADRISGVVLVDPVPAELLTESGLEGIAGNSPTESSADRTLDDLRTIRGQFEEDDPGFTSRLEFPNLPVTVILPGIQPDPEDWSGRRLRELQRRDLLRFTHAREVIAGRSRYEIPTERPDVIVDAIHRHVLPTR